MLYPMTCFSSNNLSKDKSLFYSKGLQGASYINEIAIDDPISEKPINLVILKVYNSKMLHIGYVRNINTTTGCNSACLPVVFSLFYDEKKQFIKLLSKNGLTKKGHAPFTDKDYVKLEMILMMNPVSFKMIKHPLELTDAITSATRKDYSNDVVKDAAYSSLRINLYHQHTLKFLQMIK